MFSFCHASAVDVTPGLFDRLLTVGFTSFQVQHRHNPTLGSSEWVGCLCSLRRELRNVAPWRPAQSLIDEEPGWVTFFSSPLSIIITYIQERLALPYAPHMYHLKHWSQDGWTFWQRRQILVVHLQQLRLCSKTSEQCCSHSPSILGSRWWMFLEQHTDTQTHKRSTFCFFSVVNQNLLQWAAHMKQNRNIKTSPTQKDTQ